MVRWILAVLVLGVCGTVQAERFGFNLFNAADVDAYLEFDGAQPGDTISLFIAGGGRWRFEGSWENDTAWLTGFFRDRDRVPSSGLFLEDEPVVIPLPSHVSWSLAVYYVDGVSRGGDDDETIDHHELDQQEFNDVDLRELNHVWNFFGFEDSERNLRRGAMRGDVDYSGRIDIDDLNLVRNNFGDTGFFKWTAPESAAIPEPASALLLATGLFAVSMLRGRSRQRSQ